MPRWGRNAEVSGDFQSKIEFVEAVEHDDGFASDLLGEEGDLHIGAIFVPIADHQGVVTIHDGQDRKQFGFAPCLETHTEGATEIENFLDDMFLLQI